MGPPGSGPAGSLLCAGKHHCHSCLPSDSECRSLLGHSAAGFTPGPGQSSHPLWLRAALCGGCLPAQPRGCWPPPEASCLSPLHRARTQSPETLFQESLLCQLPTHPGHLGTRSCPSESGWLIWKNLGQNKPKEVQGSGSLL